MKKSILIFTIFLLGGFYANAQFTVSAEYRVRGEANHGYKSLPVDSSETATYVSQRTRLNLKYKNDKFTTYLSIQDVRLWGQEDIMSKTGINYNSYGLDISQAWFDWKFEKNWGLKTGRQIWSYDDARLLASRNWNQTALSWDAFLLHFDHKKFKAHLGVSINNTNTSFNQGDFDPIGNSYEEPLGFRIKYFNFLWLNFQFTPSLKISFANYISSYRNQEITSEYNTMATSGLFANYNNDGLTILANAFYQYGKSPTGTDKSAYLLTLDAKVKAHKFVFGLGIDYLSGNDKDSDTDNAFDLLYGARFKYNGWMNYYLLPGSTNNGGLRDIYPNIRFNVNKKHSLYATYHFFSVAEKTWENLTDEDIDQLDKSLGGELDFSYTYKFDKSFKVDFHFGYYMETNTTEFIKGVEFDSSDSPYWASIMLTFKPLLFTNK